VSAHIELAIFALRRGSFREGSRYFAKEAVILMMEAVIIHGLQGRQLHHMWCIDE
jgi:hypothetical protein